MSRVRIFNETDELYRAAAERIAHLSQLAVAVPEGDPPRVTLTLPAFNACAEVLFLTAGAAKAPALAAVLEGPPDLVPPAGRVRPEQGEVLWLVDRAAAALLQQRSHSNE